MRVRCARGRMGTGRRAILGAAGLSDKQRRGSGTRAVGRCFRGAATLYSTPLHVAAPLILPGPVMSQAVSRGFVARGASAVWILSGIVLASTAMASETPFDVI